MHARARRTCTTASIYRVAQTRPWLPIPYTYTPPYTHLKYTPRPKPATARAWTLSPDSASPPADIYLHLLVRRPQRELLEYPHYLIERLQGKQGEVAEGSGR